MAPKSVFRGAGRNALDLPVAGLSALAAAFAAFAVPQDLLARAVVATGLPSILSAAQPPLGLTARVAIAVAAAVLVFGIVFLLLRLFDRSGMSAPRSEADEAMAGPRVRRRDGHPDAPAPRPISAARDLGEPAPPRAHRAAAPAETVPLWLDEAVPVAAPAAEAEPEPEPEPVLELDAAAELTPEFEPFIAPEPEWTPEIAVAPEPEPEPVAEVRPEPEAQPEPEPQVVVAPEPDPEPVPVAVAPEPEPEPEPAPVAVVPAPEPEPVPVIAAAPEPQPQPAPRAPVPQADMPSSIGALMERLEQGLARRRTVEAGPAAPVAPAAQPAPAPVAAAAPVAQPVPAAAVAGTVPPQVFPEALAAPPPVFPEAAERAEPANDRLQSAIASLQRLAARS